VAAMGKRKFHYIRRKDYSAMGKRVARYTLLFGMMAILLLSVMIGCSTNDTAGQNADQTKTNTDQSKNNQSGDQPKQDNVSIRMSWWGGESRHKATLQAIELYQQKNPHVKIVGEYGGWDGYLEKLTTQLAAGTAPDIMQTDYQFLDQFSKQSDLFVDLNKQSHFNLSGYSANFLKGLETSSGKLIGAPTGISASTFYINKTLADKVGIDYSKQLTWDRILEEGKKLHAQNSNMYLLNMTIDYDLKDYIFEPYLLNITGNKLVNDDYTLGFDRDALIQTFNYIVSLYDNGVIQPASETANIKTGQLYQNPKWLNNEIVAMLSLNSFYSPISKSIPGSEIIVADFPSPKGVENSGIIMRPTNMWSVNAKSKHSDEALKFLNWLMNDAEATKILGLQRSIPAVESARQTLLNDGVIDRHFDYSVKYAVENQGLPQTFVSLNKEIQMIENDILAKVAYKEYTPEKAADEMIKLMTDKLNELKGKK
jgi:oligogalacturonide transport system substrate-binding protein